MPMYQKCIPHAYHASIFDIDYDQLKRQGIKSLFFDLDNTIIGYDEDALSETQLNFLKELKKEFDVLIISNTNYKRVYQAVHALDVPFIWHAKKPLSCGFRKAIKMVQRKKHEVVIIGDQLMTDVFGANRFGISAILVKSVKRKSDRKITQFNRKIEKVMLKKIEQKEPQLFESRLKQYVNDH